jgi:recombination protein RecA
MAINERMKAVQAAMGEIEKTHGKGAIMMFGDKAVNVMPSIPTGAINLDLAIGVGGVPRGRVVELYGPESCLDKDTFIQYGVRMPDGTLANHKGGSIERLWERFHGEPASGNGKGKYIRPATIGAEFWAPSVNEDGRIFSNKIVDVVKTGVKPCWKVTTLCGETIIASAEHKFYLGDKYVPLSELEPGMQVFIHNNTHFKVDEKDAADSYTGRVYLCVKNHPVAGTKHIRDKEHGYDYVYKKLARARAVVEAGMNEMSLHDYVERLNSGDLGGLVFLEREDHVHHLDEMVSNDSPDNLAVISAKEHGVLHSLERHNNLRFTMVLATISSIEPVGDRETYDIRMTSPFNNYVADGFVVHNSGKSTLCLSIVAQAQKAGGIAAYIDAEHAMDPDYASKCGVNIDELFISQPSSGEEALSIVETLVKSGGVDIIIVDSVAALTPQAELDGDMGAASMGLQARLMGQAMRKLTAIMAKSNTTVVFINQLREKIGVMFGSPETTPGGKALKFYASVRIDIRRVESIKNGTEVIGNRVKVKLVKNKCAPPFREAQFDIMFGKGINVLGALLDVAVDRAIVEKSGAWFSYKGERIGQGREQAQAWLHDHQDALQAIDVAIRVPAGASESPRPPAEPVKAKGVKVA